MSLATDLLDHAEALVAFDRTRPRQANLRRAVSGAYYALFHKLIDAAVVSLVGNAQSPEARALRAKMVRWYAHGKMKAAANWFRRSGKVSDDVKALLGFSATAPTGIVPPELVRVATTFAELQEDRHRADYDVAATFSRSAAHNAVARARGAFADWDAISATPAGRLFSLLMLTGDSVVQAR